MTNSSIENKIRLTKSEAARRQLRMAIKLWFMEEDPVSIHTLAQAAHEIIHTLFKRKGLEDLLFDSDLIKDEYRKDWSRRLKADANFFKHADKDPDTEREFDPRVNQYLLLFSIAGISRMKERLEDIEPKFGSWPWGALIFFVFSTGSCLLTRMRGAGESGIDALEGRSGKLSRGFAASVGGSSTAPHFLQARAEKQRQRETP
jgi:hypothetical protein